MKDYLLLQKQDKELEMIRLLKIINAYEKIGELCNKELLEARDTIEKYKKLVESYQEELQKAQEKIHDFQHKDFYFRAEVHHFLKNSRETANRKLFSEDLFKEKEAGFYSDIFYVIANLELSEKEAEFHWKKVLEHAEFMSQKLNRQVSFRVAMLDYFLQNKVLIKNPKIVEFEIFEEVTKNSILDELTGIYNRRYFNTSLFREIKRCSRYGKPLSLFTFDLDNFKLFNDNYGHSTGDKALQVVADILKKNFRTEDTIARIGGEEFCAILPEVSPKTAIVPALRFTEHLKEESSKLLPDVLTISGGIAHYPLDGKTPEELYIAADRLAYSAKKNGKNQIVASEKI